MGISKDAPGTRRSKVAPVVGWMVALVFFAWSWNAIIDRSRPQPSPLVGRSCIHLQSGVEGTIVDEIYRKKVRVRMYSEVRGFYLENFMISELEIEIREGDEQ